MFFTGAGSRLLAPRRGRERVAFRRLSGLLRRARIHLLDQRRLRRDGHGPNRRDPRASGYGRTRATRRRASLDEPARLLAQRRAVFVHFAELQLFLQGKPGRDSARGCAREAVREPRAPCERAAAASTGEGERVGDFFY